MHGVTMKLDGWEPVPRTASLQHVSAPGLPLSSVWKSLSRGLMSPVSPANNHFPSIPPCGQRLGSAPAVWLVWEYTRLDAGQSTSWPGILGWCAPDREACCLSPPLPAAGATCPLTSRPAGTSQGRALGNLIWSLCGSGGLQHSWVRWGQEEGREVTDLAVDWATGQWYSWKEPADSLARLQSTGKGSLCPLSLLVPPLHLLDHLHPWFSSIYSHIHHPCVCKNKKASDCHGKKAQFFKWERSGSFETVGNSSGVLKNILIPAVGAGLACATADRYAFKETITNVSLNGTNYLENF